MADQLLKIDRKAFKEVQDNITAEKYKAESLP
jgi:hypothetical protein